MHNSSVFSEEEKTSLTNVASHLAGANSKCFTVCFTTKIDEKVVLEKMKAQKVAPDAAAAKALAKELLTGQEKTLVARLSKAEHHLGRSLVIDLHSQGYRQVDHRTIKWLIIDNVKYVVNKK